MFSCQEAFSLKSDAKLRTISETSKCFDNFFEEKCPIAHFYPFSPLKSPSHAAPHLHRHHNKESNAEIPSQGHIL